MDAWTERWNERYKSEEFAYGTEPNSFLKEQLQVLEPGKILFAAEGEGRNAVYAATLGWVAAAFDISEEGMHKATLLAEINKVSIDYKIGDIDKLGYKSESFDALALIYAHFPAEIKSEFHKTLSGYLRKGGTVIFEAFSKKHLEYLKKDEKVGGPKEIDMLFSIEEIKSDFHDFEIIKLVEQEIELSEGIYHNGKGSVIRFVGKKN